LKGIPEPKQSRDEAHALYGWAILIAAALLGFWLSEGHSYHQFMVGVLMSSATLFVLMTLIELLLRAIIDRQPRRNERSSRSDVDD